MTGITRLIFLATLLLSLAPVTAQALCSASAVPVSFGTYLPFSATPTDSTGSVTVGCTLFTGTYTIALNAGLYGGGNFSNRRMSISSVYLGYQLYTNAARSIVWGNGTSGTTTASSSCSITCNKSFTVYGRMPARQVARPGTYVDTIVVTVSF